MRDYKPILGMDWLSQYQVMLEYFEKSSMLKIPGIHEFTWRNQPEDTTHMIAQVCIFDIKLVQEFLHMFLKGFTWITT